MELTRAYVIVCATDQRLNIEAFNRSFMFRPYVKTWVGYS